MTKLSVHKYARSIVIGLIGLLILLSPNFNLSPDLLCVALCICLIRTGDAENARRTSIGPFFVGILSCAILCLKTTYIIPLLSIVCVSYFQMGLKHGLLSALKDASIAGSVSALLAVPYAWSTYKVGGTLLFPFLGAGFLSTDEVGPPEMARLIAQTFWVTVGTLFSVVAPFKLRSRIQQNEISHHLPIFGAFTCVLAGFGISVFAYRYLYPHLLLSTIVSLLLMSRYRLGLSRIALSCGLLIALIYSAVYNQNRLQPFPNIFNGWVGRELAGTLTGGWSVGLPEGVDVTSEGGRLAVITAQLQRSIPEGESVIAVLPAPFLLDFKRNRIFVMDWPGSVTPGNKPFPAKADAALWQAYLLDRGISFVIFADDPGWFARGKPDIAAMPRWNRRLWSNLYGVMDGFDALSNFCTRTYNFEMYHVLDCRKVWSNFP